MVIIGGLVYEVYKLCGDPVGTEWLEKVDDFDPRNVDEATYIMVRPSHTHRQGTGCWLDAMVFKTDNRDLWAGLEVREEAA